MLIKHEYKLTNAAKNRSNAYLSLELVLLIFGTSTNLNICKMILVFSNSSCKWSKVRKYAIGAMYKSVRIKCYYNSKWREKTLTCNKI